MTFKPQLGFVIWRCYFGIAGENVGIYETTRIHNRYRQQYRKWRFIGQTTDCVVLTEDETITRREAINYCSMMISGTFMSVEFNLKELDVLYELHPKTPHH